MPNACTDAQCSEPCLHRDEQRRLTYSTGRTRPHTGTRRAPLDRIRRKVNVTDRSSQSQTEGAGDFPFSAMVQPITLRRRFRTRHVTMYHVLVIIIIITTSTQPQHIHLRPGNARQPPLPTTQMVIHAPIPYKTRATQRRNDVPPSGLSRRTNSSATPKCTVAHGIQAYPAPTPYAGDSQFSVPGDDTNWETIL